MVIFFPQHRRAEEELPSPIPPSAQLPVELMEGVEATECHTHTRDGHSFLLNASAYAEADFPLFFPLFQILGA